MSYNLEIYQGSDYSRTFTVLDNTNNIVPLTGCSLYSQIKRNLTSTESVSFNINILNEQQALVSLTLPYTITSTLHGTYKYDIFLIDPYQKHFKIENGLVTFTSKITNYP